MSSKLRVLEQSILSVQKIALPPYQKKGQAGAGKCYITHPCIHLGEPQLLSTRTTIFRKKCLPVIQQQLFFFPIEIVPGSSRQANTGIPFTEKTCSQWCSGRQATRHETENTQAEYRQRQPCVTG